MKPKVQLICLLLMIAILFGCSPKNYSSSPYLVTATLQISNSLPSLTSIPATSPLLVPSMDSSPTVAPNLEASEAYLLLRDFMRNDTPCQLPCWGGVTPGVSTVSEAEKEFMRLSSIFSPYTYFGQSGDTWYIGSLDILYPLINTVVNIYPSFLARSDDMIVIYIRVGSQFLPHRYSPERLSYEEYNVLLSDYSMPQMFAKYGLPNLIYTRADINAAEPTAPDFFIIRLLYLDLGIFVSYTMPMEEKGTAFRFCPSESIVTLDLTSQDIGENYEDFFQQIGATEWTSLEKTHHQPLEDALGMTKEKFSQAIISSPETCFETPIDIWPEP